MNRIVRALVSRNSCRQSERGATATEYGLLVGFIAFAIIVGVTAFGAAVNDWYSRLGTAVGLF